MRRLLAVALCALAAPLAAQGHPDLAVDGRGVTFTSADGATRITMRFRMQQIFTARTEVDDGDGLDEASFQMRRTRFRLGGTVFDPRLSFNLQLSFTRADQDFSDTRFANILRDGAVTWRFSDNLLATMGQTKLPGNRQRVVSSADLELPERSIVNNRFTFDRDVGLQVWWADTLAGRPLHVRTAISGGEGRNPSGNDEKIAVTARVEWQPLGPFLPGSDDFEGDLARHPEPRLAIAVSGQHNAGTLRTGGQLGPVLWAPRSFTTVEADALLKYRGLSVYLEGARRTADDPITTAPGEPNRYLYVGHGIMGQVSYQVGGGFAPVVRWARVTPDDEIADEAGAAEQTQWSAGVTKYFFRHRVKSTVELVHDERAANAAAAARETWLARWGVEVGI